MSGIPTNGAQRASRQGAGHVTLGLPRKNRRTTAFVIGQVLLGTALILAQLFVSPGLDRAEAATRPVLVSVETLRTKPTSGAAWNGLKSIADQSVGTLDLSDQDENSDITVLAKGLVYARTGTASYRSGVVAALKAAIGTEDGGRTLALGRNLPGLVIAADLVSLQTADPAFDTGQFRPWLRGLLTEQLDGRTLVSTHEDRPNNWGTHAGAARVAVAAYLGDTTQLARAAKVFQGFLGARATYAGFNYGDDLTWQCDPAHPVGINPAGCKKNGVDIGGVIPDDMRRGGSFRWPPSGTEYPWESLQGSLLQAELLHAAGYDSFNWEGKALLRAVQFLYNRAGWPANDDDEWQTWLIDARYGTSYKLSPPVRHGKNFGFTDWIYGPGGGGGVPAPTPAPTAPPAPTPAPTAPPAPTPTSTAAPTATPTTAPTPAPTATPAPTPTPPPASGTASVSTTKPSTRIVGGTSFTAGTVPLVTSWSLKGDSSTLARYELQRSIDGGSWRGITLASAKINKAIIAAAPGHTYRFRVRAIDGRGRAASWVAGPTMTPTAVQESAKAAAYGGTWISASYADYLGGKARASKVRGSEVTYRFNGRNFGFVGPTGPTRGRAYVYLDGKLLLTMDTYSSTFRARRVIQTIFTSDGTHSVTIRVLGTSGRPWVAVDAFFVLKVS